VGVGVGVVVVVVVVVIIIIIIIQCANRTAESSITEAVKSMRKTVK
jgi:hypothetical protein